MNTRDEPDKYDLAIEYLTSHPDEITDAWGDPANHPAGCLFEYATREVRQDNIGCLTLIRRDTSRLYTPSYSPYVAATPELTKRIRNDERIPLHADDIEIDDLPVLAEWQRILDMELGQ